MAYAYQTEQGREAIRRRNETAEFYACIHGFETDIDPDPLSPLAVSFTKDKDLVELSIIRNRSETLEGFRWPSILLTAKKLEFLINRAHLLVLPATVIVGMADNTLLRWEVVNQDGVVIDFAKALSYTKGDCMGSHLALRENAHLPISEATVLRTNCLV